MNIIKGIDRIALVLAVIIIIPGFIAGWEFTQDKFKTVSAEYKVYGKMENQRKNLPEDKKFTALEIYKEIMSGPPRPARPAKYLYPPIWQMIIGGLIFALVYFFFVLFGIRGSSRGIRRLSQWIIEGFKDGKK